MEEEQPWPPAENPRQKWAPDAAGAAVMVAAQPASLSPLCTSNLREGSVFPITSQDRVEGWGGGIPGGKTGELGTEVSGHSQRKVAFKKI